MNIFTEQLLTHGHYHLSPNPAQCVTAHKVKYAAQNKNRYNQVGSHTQITVILVVQRPVDNRLNLRNHKGIECRVTHHADKCHNKGKFVGFQVAKKPFYRQCLSVILLHSSLFTIKFGAIVPAILMTHQNYRFTLSKPFARNVFIYGQFSALQTFYDTSGCADFPGKHKY